MASRSPAIRLLTPTLAPYDAIGNDVRQMAVALIPSYSVDLYAEGIDRTLANTAKPLRSAPEADWSSTDDVLIYHHSMGWPLGEKILFRAKNRVIIRYHNVTPSRFFAPYSLPHEQACQAGAESTQRIAQIQNALIVGDSTFNCEGFIEIGVPPENCRVLPPFHLTEELGREPFHMATVQQYSGELVNILFVGGIKPNKGHARAIHVLAAYRRHFNERCRLIFAGGMDDRLNSYVDDLRQLAAKLGVAGQVIFTGAVSGSQMKTLYTIADVFLCTSEHEGFCVPLVEAMYFRTPIVAWAATAVPETLGDCGVLLEDWDEFLFASRIAELADDTELAGRFGDLGRKRYLSAFAPEVLKKKLCEIIAGVAQPDKVLAAMSVHR